MFIVTLLSGSLATRLKENAKQSAHTAYRTKILFETNQLLQKEQDENAVITATAGQLMKLLKKILSSTCLMVKNLPPLTFFVLLIAFRKI